MTECPSHASNKPNCTCDAHFDGQLQWEYTKQTWKGTCAPTAARMYTITSMIWAPLLIFQLGIFSERALSLRALSISASHLPAITRCFTCRVDLCTGDCGRRLGPFGQPVRRCNSEAQLVRRSDARQALADCRPGVWGRASHHLDASQRGHTTGLGCGEQGRRRGVEPGASPRSRLPGYVADSCGLVPVVHAPTEEHLRMWSERFACAPCTRSSSPGDYHDSFLLSWQSQGDTRSCAHN